KHGLFSPRPRRRAVPTVRPSSVATVYSLISSEPTLALPGTHVVTPSVRCHLLLEHILPLSGPSPPVLGPLCVSRVAFYKLVELRLDGFGGFYATLEIPLSSDIVKSRRVVRLWVKKIPSDR
ncbi:MAG: hypothetical protein AVDCRST_MAG93-5114, partial [uncultured Chloroflexia bacterium]